MAEQPPPYPAPDRGGWAPPSTPQSPPAPPAPPASPPARPAAPAPSQAAQPAAPDPQAPVRHDPADYYEQQQVDTRPCLACGGELVFDIAAQALACPFCGAREEIVHRPDAAVVEQSLTALRFHAGPNRQSHLVDEKEIVCQNCGGHTTFVGTMTSTKCPYCASDIQRTDVHEAPDRLIVDGVLPFAIDERSANEALGKWINSRWFAPNEFKKYSTHGSFSSVYSAYFTFDADCLSHYRGRRGDDHTRTEGHGDEQRTVTETHWHSVSGTVHNVFDDLMVPANTGFDPKRIEALAPWPTEQLQPFNRDYLAGHVSRTYDRDVEECFVEAKAEMDASIESTVRRDIGGDHQRINEVNTDYRNPSFKHVLLPIWLLTVVYAGKPLQVYMNGVTGEIHGQRPWSTIKIVAAVVAAIVLLALIVLIAQAVGG